MSSYPNLKYFYSKADYIIKVNIISKSTKQIGYKYDRNNQNIRQKYLRATEGNISITANVNVFEKNNNKLILGPFNVTADADFDYIDAESINDQSFIDSNGNIRTILSYSLGQLEGIDTAKEAALTPLYRKLSKKIIDSISIYW
ncbi:MAG: hypothetical protein A3F40_05130 [Chlamydiae bacterium RIFCSPHIGHO2_12_FULL_27_8]|nr:MAG: hypothetical protein A3F40_05130 [Chlamydiae bacterium RIFCSPHIGHO2_12_FULL_27_8]